MTMSRSIKLLDIQLMAVGLVRWGTLCRRNRGGGGVRVRVAYSALDRASGERRLIGDDVSQISISQSLLP